MNWRTLKIFAIAVLLAVNTVLLGTILGRVRSTSYYDAVLVDNAIMLFRESGLWLDDSFLKAKIERPVALVGTFDAEGRESMSENFASLGYRALPTSDGVQFLSDDETFFIGNDFSFNYRYKEEDSPSVLLWEGDCLEVMDIRYKEGPFAIAKKFLSEMLLGKSEQYCYDFTLESVYSIYDGKIVVVSQTVNGVDISSSIALLLRNDRVCAAEGRLAVAFPEEAMTAQTVGLMEILFSEKEVVAASDESKVVSDVYYALAPYFDGEGKFYFVPTCNIVYADGDIREYNFVSGEVLEKNLFWE